VKTAFDILQELKIHGFPMTEHTYNELIRVYAGACLQENVKEEHIDMYLKDSMELFKTLEKSENGSQVSIQVLNSLLLLYTNALRPE
jgi:pentatricopeptide repeat protein